MKITAYEEYGLRIVLRLANLSKDNDSLVSLSEIAKLEGISNENTAAILSKLRDAELVESVRGKYGGYKLNRAPSEITLYQIVNGLAKETFDLNFCESHSGKSETCVHNSDCTVRSVWSSVNTLINNFLDSITLEQLMNNEKDFVTELQNSFDLQGILQNG